MKVDLKKPKMIKKKYHGQEFLINPYVSLVQKEAILTEAYKSYLKRIDESGGLIEAITGVDADIQIMVMGFCATDAEFDIENTTYEDLLNSGFLYFVLDEVVNYQDIRNSAHDMIRLFVICERIPDISEISKFDTKGLDKETIDGLTEIVKNIE